jgi:tetratricopeptide (TPR) repeat protein
MVSARCAALLLLGAGMCLAQTAATAEETLSGQTQNVNPPRSDTETSAVPAPGTPTALSPHKRGDILMARKKYRDAIETYDEGIRDTAIVYNKIGIAYHHLMEFKEALGNYNMALRLNPNYAEAINNIGTVHYAQKNHKRAIKEYKRALKFSPKSASILSNLGTAYFARRKYKDAFNTWQKACALDPDVFEHRSTQGTLLQERSVEERAKFHFYLAKTYARAGMLDRALLYIRKALEEGFRDRDRLRKDPDFKDLQELEEFQALLAMKPRVL